MQRENDGAVDYYMKSETDVKFELAKNNFWISIRGSDFNSNTKIRASRQNIFFLLFFFIFIVKKEKPVTYVVMPKLKVLLDKE